MPTPTRPWLPTTPRETAVAFTLNLALMGNMTLVAFLLSGDIPSLRGHDTKPLAQNTTTPIPQQVAPATVSQGELEPADRVLGSDTTPAVISEPMPDTFQVPPQFVEIKQVSKTSSQEPAVEEPADKSAEPKKTAPPIKFFGVPVE